MTGGRRRVDGRSGATPSWVEHQAALIQLARSRLFFLGGAPRSGTTWLQSLLDCHPDVRCAGEGLFLKHLAEPLDALMAERRRALADKNARVFAHAAGYPLPETEDTDLLLGTGVLAALARQCAGRSYHAVGEKTPENVFLFPRLRRLFPGAKFIGIARDPRDVLTSAWHFFHRPVPEEDEVAAKIAFIGSALASLDHGARTMLALAEQAPADCLIVTYERMRVAPTEVAAQVFRFLGVADHDALVADCVERTSFAALSGRAPGMAQDGSFFRTGVVGDWPATLNPEMNAMIQQALGWMFPCFGWTS
jgi:hypothetical protein